MKRILTACLLAILCASQASAETFRSSSDNQPRFKADAAPAAAQKTLRDAGCKAIDKVNATSTTSALHLVGTCSDGSVWTNQRSLSTGTGEWRGWKPVPMEVYLEEPESE